MTDSKYSRSVLTLPARSLWLMQAALQKQTSRLLASIRIFWLLTESDFFTFVIPDTAFGVLVALAGPILTGNLSPSIPIICSPFPYVLVWNRLNLAIFDLANQRSHASIGEDSVNKPWRPIPTGLMTSDQVRRTLLVALPSVLAINCALGAWQETALLFALTWMYNDLEAGDEHFLLRNLVICVAFGCYNLGSLRVACGNGLTVTYFGCCWILVISAVIFCTMQIQDLKDIAGDNLRDRRTVSLILGETAGRWTVIIPIIMWSATCPLFIRNGLIVHSLVLLLGCCIALRVLLVRTKEADRMSWQIWAGWLLCLYALPLVKQVSASLEVFEC